MEINLLEEYKRLDESVEEILKRLNQNERLLFNLLNKKIDLLKKELDWLEKLIIELKNDVELLKER